jgi:hypothetical protein
MNIEFHAGKISFIKTLDDNINALYYIGTFLESIIFM